MIPIGAIPVEDIVRDLMDARDAPNPHPWSERREHASIALLQHHDAYQIASALWQLTEAIEGKTHDQDDLHSI